MMVTFAGLTNSTHSPEAYNILLADLHIHDKGRPPCFLKATKASSLPLHSSFWQVTEDCCPKSHECFDISAACDV